jgi:hypothetical protein
MLFLLTGAVAQAQLSFLPQVGFEQSRTKLNYGNALSTSGIDGNFKASLKVNYQLKGGHSPFINLSTSPASVNFAFSEDGSLINSSQPVKNNLQFRLEGGYQYSSNPIQFKKRGADSKTIVTETNDVAIEQVATEQRKSCGSSTYKSHCGEKKVNLKRTPVNNNYLNMRLQPSLALAYIPSTQESIKPTGNGFEYNATNWKTAIVPAMGFEFAKGQQRLFTLSVFYTKAVGQNEETFTSSSGTKAVVTRLNPGASTWGMTLGVPFSFAKWNAVKIKEVKKEKDCNKIYYKKCTKI